MTPGTPAPALDDDLPQGGVDPRLTEAHVAHWVFRALRSHFSRVYGEAAVDAAIRGAGLAPSWFGREGWVSYTFLGDFFRGLVEHATGERALPPWDHPFWQQLREAGRRSFTPELVGPLYPALRLLGSPERVYRAVPRVSRQGSRVTAMEVLDCGAGHCTVRAAPTDPAVPDQVGSCWNRLGLLEGVPHIWGLPFAEVEHRECMHHPRDPAPACIYRIRFHERPLARIASAAVASAAGATLPGAALAWGGDGLLAGLAAAAGGALALAGWAILDGARSRRAHRRYAEQVGEALEAADGRYEALWREDRALHRANLVTRKVAAYLAQDLVDRIVEHPELELTLGGRRIEAAVLFADIVGFTRRSLGRPPEEVVSELNTWFGGVDPIVTAHGGVVDKRLGDGLMVVFASRPGEPPEALRLRAVACGVDLLRALPACNRALAAGDREPLRIRVGLAAGPLVLGNMGSPIRLEYTVIGDVVNIAARLQGLADPDHLLVERRGLSDLLPEGSGSLPGDAGPPVLVALRHVAVRGVGDDVEVLQIAPHAG